MKKIRLFNYLWPSYFIIAITMLVVVAIYSITLLKKHNTASTQYDLETVVSLSALQLRPFIVDSKPSDLSFLIDEIAARSNCRLTLISPTGNVLADSNYDFLRMGSHEDRPEIQAAFKDDFGYSTRFSETKQKTMMYVAKSIFYGNKKIAVIRASKPISTINETNSELSERVFVFCLFASILTFFFSLFFARKISRPLDSIKDWAEAFADSKDQRHIPSAGIIEIDVMANTINTMAEQLQDRLDTISEQKDEENTLFPSMIEGVFTVDLNHKVLKLNHTTRDLFDIGDYKPSTPIESIIRHPEVHNMVREVIDSQSLVQREIYLPEKDKYLQINGSALIAPNTDVRGALFVINDITHVRKMELNHREFVANVSHELKTPITSIIGFSETLVEDKDMDQAEREHFLDIIYRQSSRLQHIIEDLLQLTSLEHEADSDEVKLYKTPIRYVLESAAQCCESKLDKKSIKLEIICEQDLHGNLDLNLFDQALINLIDNAIKYSDEGSNIYLRADLFEDNIQISVEDEGCGIASEHHDKLFTRFYVVDKSRSRKLGGTGLGLAIVKHIVLAHKGKIGIESQLGKGTKFNISLPILAE